MKLKEQKGVLTIEATISLTAFLFMFIIIYDLINICSAQAAMQVALNNSAKQLAEYSYLYGLIGFDESLKGLYKDAGDAAGNTKDFMNNLSKTWNALAELGNEGKEIVASDTSLEGKLDQLENMNFEEMKNGGGEVIKAFGEAFKDPKKTVILFVKMVSTDILEVGKNYIAGIICKGIVDNNLRTSSSDTADAFCRRAGIVGGYDGVKFSRSSILTQNTDNIKIVAEYDIKVMQLLPVDVTFHFVQVAQTKAWMHGDGTKAPEVVKADGETPEEETTKEASPIWSKDMDIADRNSFIRKQVITELVENEGFKNVSNETYIKAYNPTTNTFTDIVASNALFGKNSVSEIDTALIKQQLENYAAAMESATASKKEIITKEYVDNCTKRETVSLEGKGEKKLQVIIVIPEDSGLKEKYDEVINSIDTDVTFVIEQGYGTALGE